MSITVVVTRDYDDVPSCFEKYEQGTKWRVNGGNLEIFVGGTTLAALYPSGNWISVYVDDAMQLHKGGDKPDYAGMPTVSTTSSTRTSATGSPTAEVIGVDGTPWTPDVTDDTDHSGYEDQPVSSSGTYFPDDDDVVVTRAAMQKLSFRPRRYRGAPAPATKAPTGPRLLPIKLRMRAFRPPSPAETVADGDAPRMLPVTMRTTIYRAARTKPGEPQPDEPDEPDATEPAED